MYVYIFFITNLLLIITNTITIIFYYFITVNDIAIETLIPCDCGISLHYSYTKEQIQDINIT